MTGYDGQMPVYLQIMQKIKSDIVNGTLRGGDRLPSVRELSERMTVNPNTMQRVMMELEREGVVTTRRGIGTFVRDDPEMVAALRDTQAEKYTRRYVGEMKALGISGDEVLRRVKRRMEEPARPDSTGEAPEGGEQP